MSFLGIGIVLSSISVIFCRQIAHSLFSLIVAFLLSSFLFVYIGNPLFCFIYLLVYTAAISILFLFVIMMLDLPLTTPISYRSLLIIGATLLLIGGKIEDENLLLLDYHLEWKVANLDYMQVLAYLLYTEHSFLLLLVVYGLLLVMVCIMLSLSRS